MTLKPGDFVYRVALYVYPPDSGKEDTWKIEKRKVASVGKKIILEHSFYFSFRKVWDPKALGGAFFQMPEEAVAAFIEQQHEHIESHKRQIVECERALAWAVSTRRSVAGAVEP